MKPLKIAMHYAYWAGEPWSTPVALKNEFLARGHEVCSANIYHDDGAIIRNLKRRTNSIQGLMSLMKEINQENFKPDIFFHLDYGSFCHAALNRKYFNHKMFWILECGDEPQSHRVQSEKIKTGWDLALSPDYPCVQLHRQRGYNTHWWNHHADVRIFHNNYGVSPIWDCVTTSGPRGNGLTDKIQKALGDQFNNERYFWGEEHAKRLCMGKMIFQCSQFSEITRRIFEGMACHRMVITDRLPSGTHINDLFIEGEDIVYYDNADDAIDKIKYYTTHDVERERIALNGYNKVIANHTVANRVDFILEEYKKWKDSQ